MKKCSRTGIVTLSIISLLIGSTVMASEDKFDGGEQLFRGDHFKATRHEMKNFRRLPDRERFGSICPPSILLL